MPVRVLREVDVPHVQDRRDDLDDAQADVDAEARVDLLERLCASVPPLHDLQSPSASLSSTSSSNSASTKGFWRLENFWSRLFPSTAAFGKWAFEIFQPTSSLRGSRHVQQVLRSRVLRLRAPRDGERTLLVHEGARLRCVVDERALRRVVDDERSPAETPHPPRVRRAAFLRRRTGHSSAFCRSFPVLLTNSLLF